MSKNKDYMRNGGNTFGYHDWYKFYSAINAEKSVEECGMDLNEEARKAYERSLSALKKERAERPGEEIIYDLHFPGLD